MWPGAGERPSPAPGPILRICGRSVASCRAGIAGRVDDVSTTRAGTGRTRAGDAQRPHPAGPRQSREAARRPDGQSRPRRQQVAGIEEIDPDSAASRIRHHATPARPMTSNRHAAVPRGWIGAGTRPRPPRTSKAADQRERSPWPRLAHSRSELLWAACRPRVVARLPWVDVVSVAGAALGERQGYERHADRRHRGDASADGLRVSRACHHSTRQLTRRRDERPRRIMGRPAPSAAASPQPAAHPPSPLQQPRDDTQHATAPTAAAPARRPGPPARTRPAAASTASSSAAKDRRRSGSSQPAERARRRPER